MKKIKSLYRKIKEKEQQSKRFEILIEIIVILVIVIVPAWPLAYNTELIFGEACFLVFCILFIIALVNFP